MLDKDPDLDCAGLEPNDLHQTSLHTGDGEVSVEDVENDSDAGYQVLST